MLETEVAVETSLWFEKPEGLEKPVRRKEDELVWDRPERVNP